MTFEERLGCIAAVALIFWGGVGVGRATADASGLFITEKQAEVRVLDHDHALLNLTCEGYGTGQFRFRRFACVGVHKRLTFAFNIHVTTHGLTYNRFVVVG